jgi:cytochrome oxidase Cu insertion factor (SCO1/SenC/PrrC family)
LSPNTSKREKTMAASRKKLSIVVLAFSLVFAVAGFASALQVGDKAPDFELESSKGGKLKLSSLKGKNVLINFYILDFNPT